jgi:hypothetical protein
VTQYLQSLGLANPSVLARVFAREQALVVNVTRLVDQIESALAGLAHGRQSSR